MILDKLMLSFNIPCWELNEFNKDISKYIHGKLLDIGCGKKQELFKDKVTEYIGLDNKKSLRLNKTKKDASVDVYGDALNLPFKSNSFDSVVALSVFEHLSNPFIAAKEAYRVLKKGGVFACTVPFLNRLHLAPHDYFRFTEHGLREVLKQAGFKRIKIKSYGGMWRVTGARLAGYIYSDILGLGYGPGDLETKPKKILLSIFAPLIILIVGFCLAMDEIHCVKKDAIHYYARCKK